MRRTTLIGLVLFSLSLSAPGALIYVSKNVAGTHTAKMALHSSGPAQGGGNVWLTTPAFSILDSAGDHRVFVAALKMDNRTEASRLCRWMPVVRDRIQTVVSGVSRRFAGNVTPTLSLEKRRLRNELASMLATSAPMKVDFVDATVEPGTVLTGGDSVVCDGNTLDRRRGSVFF